HLGSYDPAGFALLPVMVEQLRLNTAGGVIPVETLDTLVHRLVLVQVKLRHLLPFRHSYSRRGARHSHIIRLRKLRIVCEKFLLIEALGLARRGHCDTDVPAIPRGRLAPGE